MNGKQPEPGEVWDVEHGGELGSPAEYEISGGRIITTLEMTPFDVTVYKLGDKYVAARSNEFARSHGEGHEGRPREMHRGRRLGLSLQAG